MKTSGVLLAAGSARRFGQDKRHIPLPGGGTLLLNSAERLKHAVDEVVIVLRPDDVELSEQLLMLGYQVCTNPRPDDGMGASIACGVRANESAESWLIMPVDLPLVRTSTMQRVVGRLRTADAVVPVCHGRRGHPVGFSRYFKKRLMNLSGEQGGRQILRRDSGQVSWLNLHDPGIYRDIDTPDDIAFVRRCLQTRPVAE